MQRYLSYQNRKLYNISYFLLVCQSSQKPNTLVLGQVKNIHNFMHVNQYSDQGLSLQQFNQQRSISKKNSSSSCPKFISVPR